MQNPRIVRSIPRTSGDGESATRSDAPAAVRKQTRRTRGEPSRSTSSPEGRAPIPKARAKALAMNPSTNLSTPNWSPMRSRRAA